MANFYVSETEEGLNLSFFVKKSNLSLNTAYNNEEQMNGVWCSSNFIEVRGDPYKSVAYKLQTSILYELNVMEQG